MAHATMQLGILVADRVGALAVAARAGGVRAHGWDDCARLHTSFALMRACVLLSWTQLTPFAATSIWMWRPVAVGGESFDAWQAVYALSDSLVFHVQLFGKAAHLSVCMGA